MRAALNKRETTLLTRIYHSSGGVLRSLLTTSEQKAAHQCVVKGYLSFQPSMADLGYSYDQWVMVYGDKLNEIKRVATENDIVSRATLWNDGQQDDEDWLGGARDDDGEYAEEDYEYDEEEYDEDDEPF